MGCARLSLNWAPSGARGAAPRPKRGLCLSNRTPTNSKPEGIHAGVQGINKNVQNSNLQCVLSPPDEWSNVEYITSD